MKKNILFLTILFSIQVVFSQDKALDSVKNLVETYKKRDSIRVKNLIQYTKYTTIHNDKESVPVIEEAIAISKEINFVDGLGSAYSSYSKYFVRKGLYSKALQYAEKARIIQDSINDVVGLIITNTAIASVYNHLDQPEKAIEINLQSLELLKDHPKDPKKAAIHFYLGSAYSNQNSNYKDYTKAAYHYNEAKAIAKVTDFKTGVMIANSSLGVLAVKNGEYQKAIGYLKPSLFFYKENKQTVNIAHASFELAKAYFEIKEIDKAIFYNNDAISIYKEQKSLKNLKISYINQSDYYSANNDFKKANHYLKEHYKIKDSIFSNENVNIIEEMQTKYETEKIKRQKEVAEKQVAISKLESQKNRSLFFASLLIAILILLASMFYYSRLKTKKQAEITLIELKETQKRLAIEKQYKNSKLKALKAQMNPHFIFNALNSIQEYILLNQKNLASDYLGKFSNLIRNYLHYSDTGLITITEEVKNLNLYLELEKLRFEENLSYIISVDDTINSDVLHIPTMIVQPYVENALKHGLLHKKSDRKLKIEIIKISDQLIECIVEDNGIGREKSKHLNQKSNKTHKSFALKATAERLELLNFGKNKKIGVVIEDILNNNEVVGTKVVLKIPVTHKL